MDDTDLGRSPSGRAGRASPEPVSADGLGHSATIPNAEWLLLDQLYNSDEQGSFAVACDERSERKLAWRLEGRGLVRWCGTNWGSHFFAITNEGKALIDQECAELRARLAKAQAA